MHEAGGKLVLQILHAGRYAKVPECVAPSPGKARINTFSRHALTTDEVWGTIADFADTAALAIEAGYDGVEVMGSEGYLAKMVPGKAEFHEMLRYFRVRLDKLKVTLRLGEAATPEALATSGFDEIVLATGVSPRVPDFAGVDYPKAVSYLDVLSGKVTPGQRVAIIGAGGIGFDVAEFLLGDAEESLDPQAFFRAWGVDPKSVTPGGLTAAVDTDAPRRSVFMFQRKDEPLGKRLGKSTGWILKARLRKANVGMTAGATYDAIDDEGLHYTVQGNPHVLPVDHVVLCAGQNSNRTLYDQLVARGLKPRLIGGADVASELDALRAIDQATRLAVTL
ncbi:2,4-dienoyl-CoA reductase [NADPH] [compost metagenome]